MEHRMSGEQPCAENRHVFKFLLPLMIVPVAIGVMRGFGRHKFAHMRAMHGEGWASGVPPMFAELHRRAHAAEVKAAEQPAPPTVES